MTINTSININVSADAFIIPNSPSKLSGILLDSFRNQQKNFCEALAEYNGFTFDENEWLIQLGFKGTGDCKSTNLVDHGFAVDINGKKARARIDRSMFPAGMFEGNHEGDILNVDIPVYIEYVDDVTAEYAMAHMLITLNQKGTGYSRFGTFEEVFNTLL